MTDFFTMPGGTANLPDSSRSAMSYVQPPGTTTSKPDDGAVVRFNTIDWEARAKAAADGAEGLMKAAESLRRVGTHNYFGDLVEGREVFDRLVSLMNSAHSALTDQVGVLRRLEVQCKSAGERIDRADSTNSRELKA